MRIVIDMLGAQTDSRFRGIGRYTLSLTQAMVRRAGPHEIVLALNAQMPESVLFIRQAFDGLLSQEQIRIFDVPASPREGGWENAASELLREAFLISLKPDIVLLTSVVEGYRIKAVSSIGRFDQRPKTAAILYDLIPLLHPETYLNVPEGRRFYFQKIEWLKQANLLLGISESSRREGIEHLGMMDDQVVNVSAAIGPEFHPVKLDARDQSELMQRLGISRDMVLYAPGGFDPRKNFGRLIEAYASLPEHLRARHQLVIVSKLAPENRQQLVDLRDQHGLTSDELVLPGYVEDADLIALYSLAALFVFPSLHEGFGLPVLEAMACGAPVIGSNCTSIPEVIGWSEALFDPNSVASIREKIAHTLSDDEFRNQLRQRGKLQALGFTWNSCADKALAALEALHHAELPGKPQPPGGLEHQHLLQAVARIPTHDTPDETTLQETARCVVFNRGAGRRQLLLDVSELAKGDARSGIQRVVRSILWECLNSPPAGFDIRPIRFDGTRYWYANQLATALHEGYTPKEDTLADFFQDDVYLCLDLLMHMDPSFHDVHRNLSVRGVSMNYIVYDLLPLQSPQWWPPEVQPQFHRWITGLGRNADRMVCISRAVADELSTWLAQNPPERVLRGPRVANFHLGADVLNSLPSKGMPDNAQNLLNQLRHTVNFLMVSTIEPRKGHAQALSAFEQLWAQGHEINLLIVGKRGWKVDELVQRLSNHAENGRRLHWLEGVSDEFLEQIYAASDCLVSASLGEGFGLPLIEAAQHGLPILARDLPVLREVAGEHAFYFSGQQPEDLAQAVQIWLHLKERGQQPGSDSLPWLTWKQSTQQLLDTLGIPTPSSTTPA